MAPAGFDQFAALFPEALCLITRAGRIVSANRAALDLFARPAEQVVGSDLADLARSDRAAIDDYMKLCSRTKAFVPGTIAFAGPEGVVMECRCDGGLYQAAAEGVPALILLRVTSKTTAVSRFIAMNEQVDNLIKENSRRRATEKKERRLRVMFDQAAVGIAVAGLNGHFEELNEKCCRILGYERTELAGLRFLDLTHPDDCEKTRRLVAQVVSGEIPHYALEKRYIRKDGSTIWCYATVTLLRDETGTPTEFIVIIDDISDLKNAQLELAQGMRRLQLAMEAGNLGDWSWESESGLVTLGTRAQEILMVDAVTPFYLLGRYIHPKDYAAVRLALTRAVDALDEQSIEFRILKASGDEMWVAARGRGIERGKGGARGAIGVVQDITRQKRIEQSLADKANILESINEVGMLLATQLDLRTLLQTVTDKTTELSHAAFGAFFYNMIDESGEAYQLYVLSGAPREAFANFGQPRATPIFAPTFRGDGPIRCDDVTKDPRYGQWAPHHGMPPGHLPVCSYLAVPVTSRSGQVIGGLFFGHPEPGIFTEGAEKLVGAIAAQAAIAIDNAKLYESVQKAAEERKFLLESERSARNAAERLSEIKDMFLATLSHELRTPLNAILGWAHVLKAGKRSAEDLHKGIEVIERNARLQTRLIEDLLDMSRITSGKLRLEVQPILPAAIVEAALDSVKPAAQAKGIRLNAILDSAAGPVSGDPARLQQVIWNLLSNAIKFTPKDGKVQVVLRRVNSHIAIEISDNGIGIKPEFLVHVFERFRQADASTTRKYGGLGLGLSIVKHLVELHGGSVEVFSPGENCGATFSVQLPLVAIHRAYEEPATEARPDPVAELASEKAMLSGVKIVVVDDERDARDLIARILTEQGAIVSIAANWQEALAQVESEQPHVFISDIGMPDVNGFDLLRRVRALGPMRGGKVPAIALTAFARSEDRIRALRAGFQVHVTKPVEPSELIAVVASVVGRNDAAAMTP